MLNWIVWNTRIIKKVSRLFFRMGTFIDSGIYWPSTEPSINRCTERERERERERQTDRQTDRQRGGINSLLLYNCQCRDGDEPLWTVRWWAQLVILLVWLNGFASVDRSVAPESAVLLLSDLAWSSKLLLPKRNFSNHLVYCTSIAPSTFTPKCYNPARIR